MLGIVTGLELEKQLCLKAYKAIAKDSPLIICAAGTIEGAERAAKDLIDQGASHLISFGLCGGLATDIETGDLIMPKTVMMESETLSLNSDWFEKISGDLPYAKTGTLISVREAVTSPQAKALLHEQSGAMAVDVESFAVMQVAKAHNLPGLILRAVLDPVHQSLPEAAVSGVNANGETRIWPVIKGLMRRPQDLPDLMRLGGQKKRACETLTETIKKAKF